MSLQIMASGKITVGPTQKTSQNGNPYTFALMSVPTNQERLSLSVFAFGEVADLLSTGSIPTKVRNATSKLFQN